MMIGERVAVHWPGEEGRARALPLLDEREKRERPSRRSAILIPIISQSGPSLEEPVTRRSFLFINNTITHVSLLPPPTPHSQYLYSKLDKAMTAYQDHSPVPVA